MLTHECDNSTWEGNVVKPQLIIISGPPAAGKSTNARPLADALGYPLFGLDEVKERIADAIGPQAIAYADELGGAAGQEVIETALLLLEAGVDVVLEGFFQSNRFSDQLARLTAISNAVLVHIFAEDTALKSRYESRALQDVRHWIHGDREKLPSLMPKLPAHMAERLNLDIPHLILDTSRQFLDVPAAASLILQKLQPELSEQLA